MPDVIELALEDNEPKFEVLLTDEDVDKFNEWLGDDVAAALIAMLLLLLFWSSWL